MKRQIISTVITKEKLYQEAITMLTIPRGIVDTHTFIKQILLDKKDSEYFDTPLSSIGYPMLPMNQ